VAQGRLQEVGAALAEVPGIIAAFSTTGDGDLLTGRWRGTTGMTSSRG
jgi:hypothetical protein